MFDGSTLNHIVTKNVPVSPPINNSDSMYWATRLCAELFSIKTPKTPVLLCSVTQGTGCLKKGVQPYLPGHPLEITHWPQHCAQVPSTPQAKGTSSSSSSSGFEWPCAISN